MMNDWFYSHSTWEVAAAVCAVVVLLPLVGLFIFQRLVNWEAREEDTSMVGLSYALCGGIYAVVLAFVAVGVYEAMDKGVSVASAEANSLSTLDFESAGLPAELALRVREDIAAYVDIVTEKEWPSQQAYKMDDANFEQGWAQVRKINLDLAGFQPSTQGQATVMKEMIRGVNELFTARRSRLLAAQEHLPDPVWQMLIAGLALVAFYVFLFGPHSFKIHVAVTSLTMFSIGLVFTLIIALDYPFRGDLSVSDDAYLGVKEVTERAFASVEPFQGAPQAEAK